MAVLVRSWNLFHGNTHPAARRSRLREMIELAIGGDPDVVCLQEVPLWALPRLPGWSGMRVFAGVARRGLRPSGLAGAVTRLENGLLRSAIAGQANAILVRPDRGAVGLGSARISDRGREPRICHAVRVEGLVTANLHASTEPAAAALELERARAFAEGLARPGEPVVLAGDLNLRAPLLGGYSPPGPGIDHVLVRGARSGPLAVWPVERRVRDGRVLSDHAPVEVSVG